MPASQGTPTIFDKIRVGFEALTGQVPTNPADLATLAGVKNDLNNDVTNLENIFGPVLKSIETDAFGDVSKFLVGIAAAIPVGSVTSLGQIVTVIKDAAKDLGGPISTQIGQIESSSLNTLVSAAAVAAGHLNLSVT